MEPTRTRIPISELDPRQALYELQEYQKELEEQNLELTLTRKQNETLIEKYTMLYDHAPSGYLTLNRAGKILELNLYALTYLYKERTEIINTDFKQFISDDTRPDFDEFFQNIFKYLHKASCEVTLSIYVDTPIYVYLEGIATDDMNNCLVTMVDITTLKQTENALELSRKEFQDYFENGSVGMSVSSPGKGWLELNQRFCQMLGYAKNELLGINWMNLSHPDDLPSNLYLYQQALDGKLDKYQLDKRFIRKDGAILYVTLSVAIERNEDGTVHHLLSSYIDITERELAEKALKESEDKYRLLIENQNDLVVKFDTNGKFLYISPSYCKLFGKEESELLGKSFIPLVHEDDVEATNNAMKKLYHYPYTCEVEQRAWTKDGWCWISWSDKAELNKNNEVVSIIGIGRIINKRKLAEKALKESEMQFRSLFENMVEGFAYCRMIYENGQPQDFIYLIVNPSFEKITGLKNVTGKKVSEVIPGLQQSDPKLFETYSRVALTCNSERYETYVEGLNLWLHISVYSPGREYFVAVFDNINERKLAEEALQESEERYKNLYENAPIGIYRTTSDGQILTANSVLVKLLGYNSFDELKGRDLNQEENYEPKYSRARFQREIESEGKVKSIESAWKRKDGTFVQIRENSVVVKDTLGNPLYFDGTIEDITEQKLAEELLKESEERFKALFQGSADAIFLAHIETGIIIDANQAACDLLAKSIEEIRGINQSKLLPLRKEVKALTGFQNLVNKLKQSVKTQPIETSVLRSDGVEVPVEILGSIITVNGKQVAHGVFRDITLRIQAEETLRASEERMREINKTDWVWEVDKNGVYTYTSQTGIDYFGASREDIIGKTPFDFMPPDEAKRVASIFSGIMANKAPIKDLENWNIRKNGEMLCFLTNGMPILDDEGNLKGYRGVDKDITDRKLTEKALKESEERYKALFEDSPDAIFLADIKNGLIIDANHAASNLLAKPVKEIIGMHHSKLHPQRMEEFSKTDFHERAKKSKQPGKIEPVQVLVIRSDGAEVPVEIRTNNITVNGKRVIQGVFRDISVHKQSEEKLKESEEKYRSLVKYSSDPIFSFNPDESYRFVNDAFARAFGKKPEEIIGKTPHHIFPHDEAEKRLTLVRQVFSTGEKGEIEVKVITHSGEVRYYLTMVDPNKNDQGDLLFVTCVSKDITQRRLAEEALKQKMNELERFNNVTVDRELKMIELKKEINQLLSRFGEKEKYKIVE